METIPQDDAIADEAPWSDALTDYDKAHLKLYMRLLDAQKQGAHRDEVCRILFNIDPASEPERACATYDSHHRRAVWMTEHGYRQLLHN